MVSENRFLVGDGAVYADKKCEREAKKYGEEVFGDGSAIAKTGRKAMEICETRMDQTISHVERVSAGEIKFGLYYCEVGKRKGTRRQRWEYLTGIFFKGNAQEALARRKFFAEGQPNHLQPNHVEGPGRHNRWDCWRTWKVSKKYPQRVGA